MRTPMIERDDQGQYAGSWGDREYALLDILEEVSSPDMNEDKTLSAYMADILELTTWKKK